MPEDRTASVPTNAKQWTRQSLRSVEQPIQRTVHILNPSRHIHLDEERKSTAEEEAVCEWSSYERAQVAARSTVIGMYRSDKYKDCH